MIDIILPTFHRPQALERAAKNARENTTTDMVLTFVVEPDDKESMKEIHRIGEHYIISKYPGSHTGAANTAYEKTKEDFFIIANDDFNFHEDWDAIALFRMTDDIGVVGVNDGMGNLTPITLVRRDYIREFSGCMDIPNTLYYPGYNHNYVDTEFSNTAKKRGKWAEAPDSIVEHMHWSFGKSPKDATYEKSSATAGHDEQVYLSRQHLFL